MPRYSKQQFSKLIGSDGRVEYQLPRMSKDAWDSLSIDAKNELACDEQVEDGWQLEDIGYSVKDVGGGKVDITVNADASNWNENEE